MSEREDAKAPKKMKPHVTEEAIGENEMFRVLRRTVALRLDDASPDDLRRLNEDTLSVASDCAPFETRLIRDLGAIEVKLDQLDFPPPFGWYFVNGNDWGPIPDDWVTSLAAEHGAMGEILDPKAPYGIESGAEFTKRRADELSDLWWLAHLGDLIVKILNERDSDRKQNLALDYGRDRQRYQDQHGNIELVQHGAKFPPGSTDKANLARSEKRVANKEGILSLCKRALSKGMGRKKNGQPNASELARIYMDAGFRTATFDSVRQIIGKAVHAGELK